MSIGIACHNALFGTAGQITPADLAEIAAQGYKALSIIAQIMRRGQNNLPMIRFRLKP